MDDAPTPLLALDPAETEAAVVELGGRPFHARSVRRHVFERGLLDYAGMTDLSKALRERLAERLPVLTGRETTRRAAPDGTVKLLLAFDAAAPDGGSASGGSVETVHIPSSKAGRGATLCVSTQVGCPVRCPFCASGKLGLERNLAAHEILEQYVRGLAVGPLSRSVVMGMGEPLLNLAALERALTVVRDEVGIGARKLTVSTVGFPDRVRRLADSKPRFELAVSLHSPVQEERDRLVPAMAGTPIAEVVAAADHWFEATGREPTYEVVLLGGDNDTPDHADALVRLLAGHRGSVNLIPYNPVEGDRWRRPDGRHVEQFREALEQGGLVATVRWSKGVAADAACGQLRQRHA